MPSSTPATGGWNDHRLRQIKTAALFVASILEDPYHALINDQNCEQFVSDVAYLQEWLMPCEQWSLDEKTQPPGISPAIFDALFSLWSIFSRLRLPKGQKEGVHSQMGLQLEMFCSKPLVKQFKGAVEQLCRLVDEQAAAHSGPIKQGADCAPTPRLVIDLDSKTAIFNGVTYAGLDPDGIRILHALHEAKGRVVTGDKLRSLPGLKGKRIDRCCKRLPSALQQIVRGETGKGYWIDLPPRPPA